MGQFSWLDCITKEQVLDDVVRKVYVLVPERFGGGHIEEKCYDGYGNFGGHDIYDLVANWNCDSIDVGEIALRDYPDRSRWEYSEQGERYYGYAVERWKTNIARLAAFTAKTSDEGMEAMFGKDWKRLIGIELACGDKNNAALRYPIKITHNEYAVYEYCAPSKKDPNQGWKIH